MAVRPAVPAVPHQSHAIARWAVLQSEPALWAAWTPAPIAASVFSACSNKEGAMGEFCTPLGCSVPQPCTAQALQKQLISGTQPSPSAPPSPVEHAVDFLTQRCVSCRSPAAHSMPLRPGLQHLHSQLVDLLQSVGQDTSVSLVIMGDHGAGKTLLVERALATMSAQHDPAPTGNTQQAQRDAMMGRKLGVVRLSGLLHLEERPAYQEIARQLCSEFGQEYTSKATFDENLAFLKNMLATLHENCKTVVFVLDAFERFARARGKQQLLYNLFDVLQHSRVQAAVIGVTVANDIMDLMEKRVRSRFSHRRMLLSSLSTLEVAAPQAGSGQAGSSAPGGAAGCAAAKPAAAPAGRSAKSAGFADMEPPAPTYADTPAGILQDMLSLPSTTGSGGCSPRAVVHVEGSRAQGCSAAFVQRHNQAVASAVRDPKIKIALGLALTEGLTPRRLAAVARATLEAWEAEGWATAAAQSMVLEDSEEGEEEVILDSQEKHSGQAQGPRDDVPEGALLQTRHLLRGLQMVLPSTVQEFQVFQSCQLSVLQLFMLAAMVRLDSKSRQVYNFEMVWDECKASRDAKGVLSAFSHGAAWAAFQSMIASNLAYWVSPGAEAAGREMQYAGVSMALSGEEAQQGIRAHASCPNELLRFMNMEGGS